MTNRCLSRSLIRFLSLLILASASMTPAIAEQAKTETPNAQTEAVSKAEAYEKLSKLLTGSTLTGYFSVVGAENSTPKPEHYEILKMTKLQGNMWMIMARIKYGKTDTTVPIVLPVEWAGKTPMITVDQLTIPGMGTFSCHVLFAGDRYAGTWQHGEKGGHLWGTISPTESSPETEDSAKPSN